MRRLKDLRANPANPRKITDPKLKALKKSLLEFGDLSGFVWNQTTGQLVGGHQRGKVLPEESTVSIDRSYDPPTRTGTVAEGYIEIDNERFTYREVRWDPTREKAANLAANKHGGEFEMKLLAEFLIDLDSQNYDLELTGFDEKEIEDICAPFRTMPGDETEDEIPEVKETKVRLGDLWELGEHRVLCGDSTIKENIERLMNGKKADMVFTSPPYLDLREYQGGLDLTIVKLGGIFEWPSMVFFINLGLIIRNRNMVRYWDEWLLEAEKRNLPLLSWNIWDKGHASAPAHQQAMFGLCHEWIFTFGEYRPLNLTNPNEMANSLGSQWGTQREKDGSLSIREKRPKIRDYRQLDSVIRLDAVNCRAAEYSGHPASFPVALPENYILAASEKSSLISDPFLGSGSTLIACEKTGRKCMGIELDPHYCDVIIQRWEKYSGKKAKRSDGKLYSEI